MLCDPRYELGYVRGDYEPWTAGFLRHHPSRGMIFLDVGAHAGYWSLLAARLVGPTGRVFAFEPDRLWLADAKRTYEPTPSHRP